MKVIPASSQSGKLMGCQSGCTIADEYIYVYPTVSFSLRMVSQRRNKTKIGVVNIATCDRRQMPGTLDGPDRSAILAIEFYVFFRA